LKLRERERAREREGGREREREREREERERERERDEESFSSISFITHYLVEVLKARALRWGNNQMARSDEKRVRV